MLPTKRTKLRRLAPALLVLALAACYPGIHATLESRPPPAIGADHALIGAGGGGDYSDGVGAFRISCYLSHVAQVDPIVAPGNSNGSHLHSFFGNTSVNEDSTNMDTGNSTCVGGTLNRTGYWVPTMLDMSGGLTDGEGQPVGEVVTSFHGVGNDTVGWGHRGELRGDQGLQVYYKTGYQGVESADVVNFPAGLRIIAGDATRTSPSYDASVVTYDCISPSNTNGHIGGPSIPACSAGNVMAMTVRFPQCWDGFNLDSANHRSHMAYSIVGRGCPATHPVPLAEITYNVRYYVQPGMDTTQWRLSSDMYDGPAGYSGHADWWNGWDHDTFQTVVDNCYADGIDCHMNRLGNGQELFGLARPE